MSATVNIAGMREQAAIIHKSLLPPAPNATISRQADIPRDGLGDPAQLTEDAAWPIPVYEYQKREGRGRWDVGGLEGRATQRFIIGRPVPDDAQFEIMLGDRLAIDGRLYKMVAIKTQVISGQPTFWNAEGELLPA